MEFLREEKIKTLVKLAICDVLLENDSRSKLEMSKTLLYLGDLLVRDLLLQVTNCGRQKIKSRELETE